ncbi:hypothetical protein [Agromyces humi]|nr:hypothetical protein [Agromyces humi]
MSDQREKRNHERDQVDAFLHSATGFWVIVGIIAAIVVAGVWTEVARLLG